MKKSAVKSWLLVIVMVVLMTGIGSGTASAAIDVSSYGTQLDTVLASGTDTMKGSGTLSYQCVSVIYNERMEKILGYWMDDSCGYRTLLIEGSGATLDYTTWYYCDGLTSTPWYGDSTRYMQSTSFAFVGEGITSIGEYFFGSMGYLMYVSLPETLTSISDYAFNLCGNLLVVEIPSSVKSIGDYAFGGNTNFTIRCKSGSYAHKYAVEKGISVYLTDMSECYNNGHKSGAAATCTSPQVCTVCGEEISSALGHDYAAATCTLPQTCTRCKDTKGSANGHSWGEWGSSIYSNKQQRTCSVCSEVEYRAIQKVTSVSISGAGKKLLAGKKMTLTASVLPSNALNRNVKWTSSNKKYATVSQNGVVKAKTAGAGKTVTITAKAADGSGKKATYKIKVIGAVKQVKLKAAKKSVKAGKTVKITATVTVGKGGSKSLKWTSSNTAYATVSAKGVVKAKKAGKGQIVTITATAKDGSGKSASINIKIK